MKTMTKTETTCFGFYFDNTREVFITNILTCILNVMFSIITCVGNSTILLAIKNTRDLHTPSYVLLGCLAFSDLLVGLLIVEKWLEGSSDFVTNSIWWVLGLILWIVKSSGLFTCITSESQLKNRECLIENAWYGRFNHTVNLETDAKTPYDS